MAKKIITKKKLGELRTKANLAKNIPTEEKDPKRWDYLKRLKEQARGKKLEEIVKELEIK